MAPTKSPASSRPDMPEYGLLPADQGKGLFAWSYAEEKLAQSRNYWLSTVTSNHTPHCMPVWAVWYGDSVYFSTAGKKATNLGADGACVVATEDALAPIILEGAAVEVSQSENLEAVLAAYTAKYDMPYPADSKVYRVRPKKVFAFLEDASEFLGSATRWTFEA